MSTSNERADLLFKASLGFPSTNKDFEFFQESVKANNYILGEEILIDNIPNNPDFSGGNTVTFTLEGPTSFDAIKDSTEKVLKFENLP